jgi:two-component system sensor kinase FixL
MSDESSSAATPGGAAVGAASHEGLIEREVPPEQVLEAAPDAMIVVDHQGTLVYVNGEAEKLFGYPRAELLGQPVEVLMPEVYRGGHAARRDAYVSHPRTRPMGQALQIVARRRDGGEFPADVKLSPLPTSSGLLVTAAVRDITDRKKAEERLRTYARHLEELQASVERKNVELEQRNRELEQFAYVSSHDLQEPLRKIVAFGDRLKTRYAPALDERGLDYLARMQSAATRMQQLINDLLEFSRLTTRGRQFQPVDLSRIVQATVADLEVSIERAGGRIEVGDLATIDADALQMRQLVQNLIGNALKFRRPGAPPEVKVWGIPAPGAAAGDAPMYELRVRDNGIGIDKKYAERIFTVFERLNSREQYEGTGIGLAICKKIAERHGGTISVESEAGRGSTFVVRLPMTQREAAEAR